MTLEGEAREQAHNFDASVSVAHPEAVPRAEAEMRFRSLKNRDWAEHLTLVMQLGLTMAGCIVFCFFVGRYLDRLFQIKGILTTIFTILGVAGGANVAYRQILEVVEPADSKDTHKNGEA